MKKVHSATQLSNYLGIYTDQPDLEEVEWVEQQGGDHAPGHAGDHVPDLRPAHQVHEGGGPAAVAHGHVSRVTAPRRRCSPRAPQPRHQRSGDTLSAVCDLSRTDPKLLKMSH